MESMLFVTTAPGFIWNALRELRVMLMTQVTQCIPNVTSPTWKVITSKIAKDHVKEVLMSHLLPVLFALRFTSTFLLLIYFPRLLRAMGGIKLLVLHFYN